MILRVYVQSCKYVRLNAQRTPFTMILFMIVIYVVCNGEVHHLLFNFLFVCKSYCFFVDGNILMERRKKIGRWKQRSVSSHKSTKSLSGTLSRDGNSKLLLKLWHLQRETQLPQSSEEVLYILLQLRWKFRNFQVSKFYRIMLY